EHAERIAPEKAQEAAPGMARSVSSAWRRSPINARIFGVVLKCSPVGAPEPVALHKPTNVSFSPREQPIQT
ncbi:MAG: hypothetical protein ACREDU_09325, partial [Methylocella sp.]